MINQNEKLTESNMTISSKKITPETEEEKNEIKKVRSKNVIESKKVISHKYIKDTIYFGLQKQWLNISNINPIFEIIIKY